MQPAPCTLLEWDSAFFGVPIARVNEQLLTHERIAEVDRWSRQQNVRCVYFLARSDDATTTRLAEEHDFHLVDIRVTLDYQTPQDTGIAGVEHATVVRTAQARDVDILAHIARQSHRDTRFYYDPNFPKQACDQLYETWIRNSCAGYAEQILVVDAGDKAAGYITCHHQADGAAAIGLLGVSEHARGQGYGQLLIREALRWFAARGALRVTVVTQGRNSAAQRVYQRCGFRTSSVELWYHKWYSTPERAHD